MRFLHFQIALPDLYQASMPFDVANYAAQLD